MKFVENTRTIYFDDIFVLLQRSIDRIFHSCDHVEVILADEQRRCSKRIDLCGTGHYSGQFFPPQSHFVDQLLRYRLGLRCQIMQAPFVLIPNDHQRGAVKRRLLRIG